MSKKKGRNRLGHIPFCFGSFSSLVHAPVQDFILIDRFLMEGYAGGISLYVIERRELVFCHPFTFILLRLRNKLVHYTTQV